MFFALEMLNVGAHHEILDDPRAPGTRSTQQIIDQIGWLKELGITETIVPMPPGISGLGEYLDRLRRSEEHTSELQSLMRISYAVFCLTKKKHQKHEHYYNI